MQIKWGHRTSTNWPLWLISISVLAASSSFASQVANVTNPLVYNRLRNDVDYLQLYRDYQTEVVLDETPIKLKLSKGPARTHVHTYYESKRISADNITYDDLVLEALDRTYVSRYIHSHVYNFDDPNDRRKASDPKLVSPSRCAAELAYLKGKLDQLALNPTTSAISPELATFFDSYANEEPGLLFGNYHWTGNWRQCSKRLIFELDRANASNSISFQGRYCIASIRSDRWLTKIEQRAKKRLQSYFKNPEQQYDYQRFFRIQVGICLPESCDSTTIDNSELANVIRQLTVRKLNEPIKSYRLVDLFCLPDETSEMRQMDMSGLLFVLCGLAWCLLVVAATCYDLLEPITSQSKTPSEGCVEKLVNAMSLRRNYARLIETNTPRFKNVQSTASVRDLDTTEAQKLREAAKQSLDSDEKASPDDIKFIDFFKVFCMPMILMGHIAMLTGQSKRFPIDFGTMDRSLLFHYYLNAIFLIDWFFIMAAFVTVYVTFTAKKRIDQITLAQWLYSIFHRYWRLAPMYIIMFWFCRSVFQHTGEGPVWDYGTTNMTLRGVCKQESWIWPTTLTSNLHPFHEECILPSWYISMSMQFYLITPFILIGLAKWPKTTWTATIVVIISSVLMRIQRYMIEPHLEVLSLAFPRQDSYTRVMYDMYPTYIYPQYRISTYLIGLLAGHYCFMVLSGRWRSVFHRSDADDTSNHQRRGSLTRRIVWFTSVITLIALMFTSYYPVRFVAIENEPYARVLVSFFYGIVHTVDGLMFALMLVTFTLGQFKRLRLFLSHPIWTILSRINFSLLLIHCELAYRLNESADRVPDFSGIDSVRDWFLVSCIAYPLAAIITLLLEMPLSNLEREFIGNWLARSSPTKQPKEVAGDEGGQQPGESEKPVQSENYYAKQGKSSKLTYIGQSKRQEL